MNGTATAYGGNEKYIFISYSHRDSDTVIPAINEMQRNGYRIWFDKGIEAGTEWSNNIAAHLRDCAVFVAFISKNSVKSENCLDEIAYAKSHGKPSLLIFLEEGVVLPEGTEMQTARFQRMFYNRQSSLTAFITNLNEASLLSPCRDSGATVGGTPYTAPSAPKKPKNTKLFAIIGGVVALIAVICIAVALLSGGDDNESSLEESSIQSVEESTASTEESTPAPITMSDDPYDATFTLDGDVFKLPCSLDDFTSKGWAISQSGYSAEKLINGLSTDSFKVSKNGKTVTLDVANRSGNKTPLSECPVIMIAVYADDGASIELAKGITLDSTKAEISAAYGTPYSIESKDSYDEILYVSDDEYTLIGFEVYADTPEDNLIELACYRFDDVISTETNKELPEYISEYSSPESIGNDLYSGNFSLEGAIYRLPAPVKAFLDNGWTVYSAPAYVVSGGEEKIVLAKGEATVEVNITNFADYQTTPENCVVINLMVYDTDKANIELPNGITLGMTESELDARVPEDIDKSASTYSIYYSHSTSTPRDFYVYLYIDADGNNTLSYIRLNCEEWD